MKTSVRQLFTKMSRQKFIRLFLKIYLAYLAVCLLVLIPLLNWAGSSLYQQQTGRPLHHALILFNPFTLSLRLNQLADKNPDGSVLWSADLVQLNFSLLHTLFSFVPSLDRLEINGFWLHAHKKSAGEWTFSDIVQHQEAQSKITAADTPENAVAIPALVIDDVVIGIRAVQFTDASQAESFHTSVDDIRFELHNFSTLNEVGQPYHFYAKANGGGEIDWRGTISVKAGKSEGELELKNIALKPAWQYVKPLVNFNLRGGDLSFKGDYQLNWNKELQWSLAQSRLTLTNLDIRSRKQATAETKLVFKEFSLEGINISSLSRQVDIAKVDLEGLHLTSWSHADRLGVVELFAPRNEKRKPISANTANAREAKPNNEAKQNSESKQGSQWVARIAATHVKAAALDWRIAELDDRLFHITPVQIILRDIDSRGETAAQVAITATVDQLTQVEVTGSINPIHIEGELLVSVQGLPVNLINPLLEPYVKAEILAGQFTSASQLHLHQGALTQIATTGNIAGLTLRPLATPEELMRWEKFAWSDTEVNLAQRNLVIPLIELVGFDSRFVITKEGTTNLQALLPPAVAEPTSVAVEKATPWQFTLQKLVLNKSSFRFNDQSLTPDFTAAVQGFSGELINLSSASGESASFDFKGDVDGYAPVTLIGKAQLFSEQPTLDARLNFENMDLGGFSTYSSTYAGWRIERGLLTANLHYRLADGRIVGDNHIEMDQLKLGKKVKSANALDIPLRLALAILTDENGVATLDVGISGRPDDPDFDISNVFWVAMRNTLVKIVSAPFTVLAKLINTKEDLGAVKFNSGSKQLLSKATRKLTLLEEALTKRPNLRIQINGQYDQNTDRRGLQDAHIKRILLGQGLSNNDIKTKSSAWEKAIGAEYKKLDLPVVKGTTAKQQYEKLQQNISITDQDLVNLAVERSVVVKQFLVEHLKVDSHRVLINSEINCINSCSARTVNFDLADFSSKKK